MTTAVLHAEQFGDTLVELVVAHAGDVEMHRVERFDGRFIVEEAGKGWRATDEVTCGDGQAELVALAQLGELRGEVLGAPGSGAIDHTGRVRLEMAMVVVECQDLKIDELTLRVRVTRAPLLPRVRASPAEAAGLKLT